MRCRVRSNGDQRFKESLDRLSAPAPPSWLERVTRQNIIVHTTADQSISGVLMEQTPDGVILRAAKLLGEGGRETSMAGETWVPRERIAFCQFDG